MQLAKPRLTLLIALALLAAWQTSVTAAEKPDDLWIFSGQSNMQKIGSAVQRSVADVVERNGRRCQSIYVAAPGKPIEAWLEANHRDHKLWLELEAAIKRAKKDGGIFSGFVWYQGESNTKEHAGKYQSQLAELISRVRKLTGEAELPVVIVQIGSATSYSGRDWAAAIIREAPRRLSVADKNIALVTAIDAEIGDYTVHLSNEGSQVVAQRVADAAERLTYGSREAYWGPQFQRAFFADKQRRVVVVQFNNVKDDLQLGEGWLAGFGASVKTSLPDDLAQIDNAYELGQLPDDYIYPVDGRAIGEGRLALLFDKPLTDDARLSYAAPRNAQYGPHRRWGLEFTGLRDASGHHAPAFVLVPIEAADEAVAITFPKSVERQPNDWKQIAVNCIGRYPDAISEPSDEAGMHEDGWRQAYWNPASAGLVPNLVDVDGRVSDVSFTTGVWYMSPYYRELKTADDALMASWCKNSLHGFGGLKPTAKYDLALYVLQGPSKKLEDDASPPTHRPVRVAVLHIPASKRERDGEVIAEQTIQVPADGMFEEFQLAAKENGFQGNVVVLNDIPASATGRIDLTVRIGEMKNGKLRWGDTTLAGVQLRAK